MHGRGTCSLGNVCIRLCSQSFSPNALASTVRPSGSVSSLLLLLSLPDPPTTLLWHSSSFSIPSESNDLTKYKICREMPLGGIHAETYTLHNTAVHIYIRCRDKKKWIGVHSSCASWGSFTKQNGIRDIQTSVPRLRQDTLKLHSVV